jgi:hypothetical protein
MLGRFLPSWAAVFSSTVALTLGASLAFEWVPALLLGLIVGLPAALAGSAFGAQETIQPIDRIMWFWGKGVYGVGLGVLVMVIFSIVTQSLSQGIEMGILVAPVAVVLLGFASQREVASTITPNHGIWRSAYSAALLGVCTALAVFFIVAGGGFLFDPDTAIYSIAIGLTLGLPFGFIVAFAKGGITCLQHSWLRLFFAGYRNLPMNCRRFLDFATERVLLRKVGGGYVFAHLLLLEHFVQHSKNEPELRGVSNE